MLVKYLYILGACGIIILISGGGVWCLTRRAFSWSFRTFLCAAYIMIVTMLGFKTSSEFNDGRGDAAEYTLIGIGCIAWMLIFISHRQKPKKNSS